MVINSKLDVKGWFNMDIKVNRRFWHIKEKRYISRKKWKYIILHVPFSIDYYVIVK